MSNNNNGNTGCAISIIAAAILVLLMSLGSCSSNDHNSKYKSDLDSGLDKYYRGEKMNEDEYNAVKDFNKWQDKQRDKTYSDWNN